MSKIQSIITAIMMTVLVQLGIEGDSPFHQSALFLAGFMFALLVITIHTELQGE